MYTSYWNLRSSPFLNSDDESFLYPSEQLREGVARLYYLIDQERVAGMVTGPYGVGKTFLLSCLVRRTQKAKIPLVRFDAIPQGGLPMACFLLDALGIDDKPATFADAMMTFQRRCMDGGRGLVRHVILIDEAHFLAEGDGLNLVHFLSNLRIRTPSGDRPLFTIVLSGPPSLGPLVDAYESLRRRIQLVWTLDPLSRQQTFEYVQQHMRAAGGDIWAFSGAALDAIHTYSGGIPRNINNICDTALMLGYAAGANAIGPDIVREAADDSGLSPANGHFDSNTQPPQPAVQPPAAPQPPYPVPYPAVQPQYPFP